MERNEKIIWGGAAVLRFVLGALFVYAGIGKLLNITDFVTQVQYFGLTNSTLAGVVGHYLPWLEIGCGAALILRRLTIGALALTLALLAAFESVLIHASISGIDGNCGCFGTLFGGTSIRSAVLRNVGLLVLTALMLGHELNILRRQNS